jgi:hypothetical protein
MIAPWTKGSSIQIPEHQIDFAKVGSLKTVQNLREFRMCDDYPTCPTCGCPLEWEDCYSLDCEDGYYHDCGEDCCCCADPEPNVRCDVCDGKGGWWFCPACAEKAKKGEIDATEEGQGAG